MDRWYELLWTQLYRWFHHTLSIYLLVDNLRSGLAFKKPSNFEPICELLRTSVTTFTFILFCAVSIVLFANVSASDAIVEIASIFSCDSRESARSFTLWTSALSRNAEKCVEASKMIAGLRKIFAVQNPDEHKKMATIIDFMNLMFDPVRRFQRNFLID